MLRHEASVRDRDAKPKGPDAKSLPEPVRENDSVRLTSPRKTYQEFLTRLAKASGIEMPTREDSARLDRSARKDVESGLEASLRS
jgi:hypothetical protein